MSTSLRALCLFLLCFGAIFSLKAQSSQNRVISGTVYDEKGTSLPGVGVTLKGTRTAVSTNVDGKYSITIPSSPATLVFTFVGMTTQEVEVGTRNTINVNLKSTATSLNDVVVIGYGSQKREDVNGAISSVKAADIANIPQVSVDQLLQGKAAGVTITQNAGGPGSATSVHIRGITSLSSSNEPLYVIDGVAISGDATNKSTSGRSQGIAANNGENSASPLSFLNPSDIESIDVLKDASATAIYGSRGSNGVIIITTKRGKAGTARVSYDGYYGFQEQGKFLPMMNLKQYANLQNALADNNGQARRGEFANPELLGEGTNWQDAIFKTAAMQSHQIAFSGGKESIDYYLSAGYLKQDGTVLGNDFNRYTLRANINSQVKDWLKVGTTLGVSRSFQNTSLSNNTGIIYTALLSAPDQAIYNADGSFAGPQAGQIGAQINPVAQALSITNNLGRDNVNGNLYADIKFTKDLTLHSEVNGDVNYSAANFFTPTYNYGPLYQNPTARLQEYYTNSTFWAWKEYLTYNKTFAEKHNLTALVAYELVNSVYHSNNAGVSNFLTNDLPSLGLGTAATATIGEYIGNNDILESQFARAIYTYNNRYSITASFRADKSSKFAQGHQVGYFPSAAVSWRLSEEPFMAGIKSMADNIKIRVGYGETGNQSIPGYLYGSALTPITTGIGTGFAVDKVPNANLTWETATQLDFGLDFSLFGRIDGSVDYFQKSSKNFLFQAALPAFLLGQSAEYSGTGVISPPWVNGGQLSNKGIELNLSSRNIVSDNFKWTTSLVFSHYKNKVVSLYNGVPYMSQNVTTSFLSLPVTRTQVGRPVGEFYGYKVKGIFQTDEQLRNAPVQFAPRPVGNTSGSTWLGDIQFEDLNNDGKIDIADQTPLGNPNPKFTYGITNTFNFKQFDLSIFLNGSYGAKIFNVLNYQIASLGSLYQNQLASVANFWTPTNSTSNTPRPSAGDNPNLYNSDRFIESGSFLRVQNVSLGYNVPTAAIKRLKLNRLRVYASGQNLYVFTPYKGLDPEIGSNNQNVFLTNVDLGRYPIPRTITFGINAEF